MTGKRQGPVQLAVREQGEGEVVILLHGFLGSAANWGRLSQQLAAHRHVIAVDLRNHGASPHVEGMGYAAMADDLHGLIEARGFSAVTLIGHSMGGKVAMCYALRFPEKLQRLVVVDIAPVTYTNDYRGILRALQNLDMSVITQRADADRLLSADFPDERLRSFLLMNLVNADGHYAWRLNLGALQADHDSILDFPASTHSWTGPALFVAGANSDYVVAAGIDAVRRYFPQARFTTIENAGHWLYAEQPERFYAVVASFLGIEQLE